MLAKLNYYGIHGVSNDWFKSYLSNCNQHVSINRYESGLAALNCGIPQGSVLGPLLFLLYINDLNQAIKFCKVHHFADDTNLLCLGNSVVLYWITFRVIYTSRFGSAIQILPSDTEEYLSSFFNAVGAVFIFIFIL